MKILRLILLLFIAGSQALLFYPVPHPVWAANKTLGSAGRPGVQIAPALVESLLRKNVVATKNPSGPILTVAGIPWATHYAEHPQLLKDGSTYHMYFHVADAGGYKIGH